MKTLRQFGLLCMALAGAMSILSFTRGHAAAATWMFAALAVILGLLGILKPRALRPLFVAAICIAFPIGWLVSHALLAIVFFGLVTPAAFIFRLIGRDRLRLKSWDAGSLWLPRTGSSESRRYFRQF